jgi:hypothetical protein
VCTNLHDKQRNKETLGPTAAPSTPLGHDVQRPRIEYQSENNEQWYDGNETKSIGSKRRLKMARR